MSQVDYLFSDAIIDPIRSICATFLSLCDKSSNRVAYDHIRPPLDEYQKIRGVIV